MNLKLVQSTLLVCLLVAGMASAAGPNLMSYQGQVSTAGGVPIANGAYPAVFAFYPVQVGGSLLWTESASITTSAGLFTHTLGSVTPILTNVFTTNPDVWLEVTVNGQLQAPRTQLTSAGNAIAVSTVDGATGGAITGNVSVSGNVGVGTTSPGAKLDVLNGNIRASSQVMSAGIEFYPATAGTPTNAGSIAGISGTPNNIAIMPVGNVGVGTPSPGAKLDVLNGNIRASSQLGSAGIEFYPASFGTPTNAGSIVGTGGIPNNIAIMPVGNVGVGTTNPSSKLEVVGDLKVSGNIIGSTPWTSFPFAAGYNDYEDGHPGSGFQRVQYRKIGDIVYIRGLAHKADHAVIPNGAIFGTLPVGFRPPAIATFATAAGPSAVVSIGPSGSVYSSGSVEYQGLDGVSFSTSP